MADVDSRQVSEKQIKFIRNLIDRKDLFKSPKHFDAVNAMDSGEYAAYLEQLKSEVSAVSMRRASSMIEALLDLPDKPRNEQPKSIRFPDSDDLPGGRYAIESEDGELRFYRLWRGTRNKDYAKLYVQHGPNESEVPFTSVLSIMQKIISYGTGKAAILYGREIGCCSVCGIRLTNHVSRELGIGPICGGRYFHDDWNQMVRSARAEVIARGDDPDTDVESPYTL